MKSHRFLVRLLAMALSASPLVCFADEAAKPAAPAKTASAPAKPAPAANPPEPVKPPDEAKLRAAIDKSLAFLAKEGDQWVTDRQCNSCHHMPMLLWSHREAKRHGFPVDQEKFDEWLFWANESANRKNAGSYEMFAYMIMAAPEHPAPVLTKRIAEEQKADATPHPVSAPVPMGPAVPIGTDPPSLRPLLLALASPLVSPTESDATRDKAAADLQKMSPPKTMDTLVYRVLYARRFGLPKEDASLCSRILKLQRGDGGWSEAIGENHSDPLGTGQALYVLRPRDDPKTADAVAHAQHWLVSTQLEAGSWPVDYTHLSTMDRSAPDKASSRKNVTMIYTYWGSAWATIGLLQAFPVTESTTAINR